jgi:hypothetical protein
MAWGLWNKIKQGIKKAGNWIKDKVIKPVVNTVIKPFKPAISAVATAINPKVGSLVNTGMNVLEKWSDGGESPSFRPGIGDSNANYIRPYRKINQ